MRSAEETSYPETDTKAIAFKKLWNSTVYIAPNDNLFCRAHISGQN